MRATLVAARGRVLARHVQTDRLRTTNRHSSTPARRPQPSEERPRVLQKVLRAWLDLANIAQDAAAELGELTSPEPSGSIAKTMSHT